MQISAPQIGCLQIRSKNTNISLNKDVVVGDFTLCGPGEYEIAGIEVEGVGSLYILEFEEMRLAYLDKINRPLTDEEQTAASEVDILFLPVGSPDVLSVKDALQIINLIDPRIIIPIHYDSLDEFTKQEAITPEYIDSLKITAQTLPEDERKVIVLPWKSHQESSN